MIDIKKIADELGFDKEDVMMLLDMFLESANQSLQNIKIAMHSSDLETIKNEAHAIKGSSANLKLDDITTIAKNLEQLLVTGDKSIDYSSIVRELEDKLELLHKVEMEYA